jgi:hypothetical protein
MTDTVISQNTELSSWDTLYNEDICLDAVSCKSVCG